MLQKSKFAWQDRDREVLSALTHKVRLLTAVQVARAWWPSSAAGLENARKRLALLLGEGLLDRFSVQSHPELALSGPVFSWHPGGEQPNYEAVSYRLRSRWTEAVRSTTVFTASRKSARIFGGFAGGCRSGGLKQPLQATHDLHVSSMFVRLVLEEPERASTWVSEETIAPTRKHQKLPDAMLLNPDGTPALVLEFGGSYRAERVERVHLDCVARSLPYELW